MIQFLTIYDQCILHLNDALMEEQSLETSKQLICIVLEINTSSLTSPKRSTLMVCANFSDVQRLRDTLYYLAASRKPCCVQTTKPLECKAIHLIIWRMKY